MNSWSTVHKKVWFYFIFRDEVFLWRKVKCVKVVKYLPGLIMTTDEHEVFTRKTQNVKKNEIIKLHKIYKMIAITFLYC